MKFRLIPIAAMAFFVGLLAGGAMLAPFAIDAIRAPRSEQSAEIGQREAGASRFRLEKYLVDLGKEPLAWDCRAGQPDRARFVRNSCFSEYVLEFERINDGGEGTLQLTTRENAVFLGEDDAKLLGRQQLSASRSDSLLSMLAKRLPQIPPHVDDWEMPAYLTAIETCVSGNSLLVVRSSNDPEFEQVATELSSLAGVKLSRSAPGVCM